MRRSLLALTTLVAFVVPSQLPATALTSPVPTVSNATVAGSQITEARARVEWQAVAAAVTYRVSAEAAGQETVEIASACESGICDVTLDDLSGGVEYMFSVRAWDSAGRSAVGSTSFLTRSVPGPAGPQTATAGLRSVTLTWLAPANSGGLNVSGFTITDGDNVTRSAIAASRSITITGLADATTYNFTITANNSLGASQSAQFTAVRTFALPGAPSAPTLSQASGSLTATWSAPQNTGGTAVTEYQVFLLSGEVEVQGPLVTDDTNYTFESLENGSYTVQVAAVNQVGVSSRSAASNSVTVGSAALLNNTPVFTPNELPPLNPGSLTNFTVSAASGSVVSLALSATPSGACVLQGAQIRAVLIGSCTVTASANQTATHAAGSVSKSFQIVAQPQPQAPGAGDAPASGPISSGPVLGGGGGGAPSGPALAPPIAGNPITAGRSFAFVNQQGFTVPATADFATDRKAVSIRLGSATLELRGGDLQFSDTAGIAAQRSNDLSFSARGLKPDAGLTAYLLPLQLFAPLSYRSSSSQIITLGTAVADQEGIVSADFKLDAPAGDYLLQLTTTFVDNSDYSLVMPINIAGAATEPGALRSWTRDFGNNQLKLYARGVIGAGKVSFFQNDREIAWVRAVDATDPKLNVGTPGARDGMVRTATPVMGRNVFEVYVDGERVVRRIFTRR